MNMLEILEAMRLNGLHDEAAAVGIVMQQRAELLGALKKILQNDGGHGSECFDALELHKGRNLGFAAITRAEAAE